MPYSKVSNVSLGIGLGSVLSPDPNPPTVNYVARLNGTDQYWQLSEAINLAADDVVYISVARPASPAISKQWFVSGADLRINVQANNKIEEVGGELYLDGNLVTNYVTEFPADGFEHKFSYIISGSDRSVYNLGASASGLGKLDGYVKNIIVKRNDVVIHEIPLTNKQQGATQLATVGTVNATMVNYDQSVWEEL